jgi:uncharacterized membrane protein YeaQ/YmgE (transglycosylase-associated protein family)
MACVAGTQIAACIRSNTKKESAMNLVLWLVVGSVLGWIASVITRPPSQSEVDSFANWGLLINMLVGIAGATLGAWLLSPLLGLGTVTLDQFSLSALGVALGGAVVMLAIVNVLRGISAR